MYHASTRLVNFCGFLICLFLLSGAYYFEFVKGMEPCLLCVLQRWIVMLLGTMFLVATLHHARAFGYRIYALLTLIISIAGIVAAGRQAWLQHQPLRRDEVCVPGLDYLLKTHPLPEVLRIMIRGGHQCAEVTWRFLGLTMAEWVLIFFIFLALLSLYQLFRKYPVTHPPQLT